MRVAVVGATGLVGQKMIEVLEERKFPVSELIPVASEKSIGKKIFFQNKSWPLCSMEDGLSKKPAVALFSAGGQTSLDWAPRFAASGCTVIDNSSAWRMHPEKKLIVPEINAPILNAQDRIISNPNCSTIQLVMVAGPLHRQYRIRRIVVSTYQSVSGSGAKGVGQLIAEREGRDQDKFYPYPIDLNLIPQIDVFLENGYTKEEMKMTNETKKILGDDTIELTATTVRVPVKGGHSESANMEFEKPVDLESIRKLLAQVPGVVVLDDIEQGQYPMPLFAEGNDAVFVGRIRRDFTRAHAINCWIVSDNLRKGAATNAVQIAEFLSGRGWIK